MKLIEMIISTLCQTKSPAFIIYIDPIIIGINKEKMPSFQKIVTNTIFEKLKPSSDVVFFLRLLECLYIMISFAKKDNEYIKTTNNIISTIIYLIFVKKLFSY
jgi:hypothetical protein